MLLGTRRAPAAPRSSLFSWASFFTSAALGAALAACGSSSANTAPDAGDAGKHSDATRPDAHEAGPPHEGGDGNTPRYPAFPVDMPQISANTGTVLASPVIVTITWPGDPNASTWEAFGDSIGASDYWKASTSEYGVGAAKSGAVNHVRMTEPLPKSLSYFALQDLITVALGGTPDGGVPESGPVDAGEAGPNPAWPAPTTNAKGISETLYSVFIPSTTAVTDPGSGASFCKEGALGYHGQVTAGGKAIAYSVALECPGMDISIAEETAAHEYVEAATDPFSGSSSTLGYVGFDPDHLAWDVFTGFNDELADACQNWQGSYYQDTGSFPYWVQRSWSNKEALAGHDPCVPEPSGPYQGMTLFPSEESSISVNLTAAGLGPMKTKGFSAKLNTPITFHVGFYSDAPTGTWTLGHDFPADTQLFDFTSGSFIGNGAGTVTIENGTGKNGDKATVTVKVTAKGPAGFHVMAITWDPPTGAGASLYAPLYLPLLIVDE